MTRKATLPAALSLVLLGMYFIQGSDDETTKSPKTRTRAASTSTMEERRALDAERAAEYREAHRANFSDVGESRREKDLDQMMRRYGNSPLETVDGDNRDPGIAVGDAISDLRSFIASGGSYSGPVPDEIAAELYGSDQ